MTSEMQRPRHRHVELAQKVLDIAIERGMSPGERLAEQALASLCNVSRTPIRKALQVLADESIVTADTDGGYVLAVDPATLPRLAGGESETSEGDLHLAMLRDLAAGRIQEVQTVAGLQRRYGASRMTVQNALNRLSEDNMVERGAGQQWVLKRFAVSVDSISKNYEFRLATEPLALTMPDFRRDLPAILALRHSMNRLKEMDESSFDVRLFERTDFDLHMLIARCCGNPFMAEVLSNFHKRRTAMPSPRYASMYRLIQSNLEHIQILEHIERGQLALAADLLRVHIQLSQSQRPSLAGRGVPRAFKVVGR
ncbi:GntR family transcriptional regulator [Rhizobium sp. S96]|uniref:GntR family transcriptional regulator n=1 Tax=Rhizobium sp. S96 TaxID=3055140 RepID=UPI0025AB29AE|nr:GntR family transcriptional regulator [Rhizobium sp. S96]MDM9624080.1 GntR family transcriptional regulator [Rhizobium sp. S96]